MGPYTIIIIFFTLASLGLVLWSWRKIAAANSTLSWSSTKGEVVISELDDNKLPRVEYRYTLGEHEHVRPIHFSEDIVSSPNGPQQCLQENPPGATFDVFYDPENPENVSLTQGPARDDKLIFYIAITAFLFGLLLIFFIG